MSVAKVLSTTVSIPCRRPSSTTASRLNLCQSHGGAYVEKVMPMVRREGENGQAQYTVWSDAIRSNSPAAELFQLGLHPVEAAGDGPCLVPIHTLEFMPCPP